MSRFDRYLLSQLMVLFGFFSLVLVGVYWVNRAVGLFDELIGNGQSSMVFLEFTALTLPNVIRLVLPISSFAAAVYVTNRLSAESELVVMQATGFSAFRLARPVLAFGLIVSLMMAVLMHVLVPASRATLADRSAEVASNVTARFLSEGQFLHPADGITFYIRELTRNGELRDLFLSDTRSPSDRLTYSATRAFIVRSEDGPKLVMFDGIAQSFRPDDRRLSVTRFEDFTYDIGALIPTGRSGKLNLDQVSSWRLLRDGPAVMAASGEDLAALRYELNNRVAQPFLAAASALIGFATLLVGAFSRFGLWRQIVAAVVLLILVQLMNNAGEKAALADPRAFWAVYAAPLFGFLVAGGLLSWQQRTRRVPRVAA